MRRLRCKYFSIAKMLIIKLQTIFEIAFGYNFLGYITLNFVYVLFTSQTLNEFFVGF